MEELEPMIPQPEKLTSWRDGLLPLHLLFIGMALLFLVLGSILQHYDFKMGILATEFGMLVLPATLYMLIRKNKIKQQFRFNLPRVSDVWKMLLASIFFVPLVALVNGIINVWLIYGLKIQAPQIPVETGPLAPLISFLIAAVTPGFCEEFVFRGLLLTEYEKKMGYFQAALISALLFGMFHYNLMNFFGPFALGLLFAWVMQVTNSIWLAMLGHMINNSLAVLMLYMSSSTDPEQTAKALEQFGNLWPLMASISIVVLIIIALPSAFVSTLFLKSIRKRHLKPEDQIVIAKRNFRVVYSEKDVLHLREQLGDAQESEVIETTYSRLYQNKNVKLLTLHWGERRLTFKLRLKEWWPVIICAIMYVGVNILNVIALMSDAAK